MHRYVPVLAPALLVVLAGAGVSLSAESAKSWPTFRGAERTAVSRETGLLQEWPDGGPPLVWETLGAGKGYASLAIDGGRIYTLGDASSIAARLSNLTR